MVFRFPSAPVPQSTRDIPDEGLGNLIFDILAANNGAMRLPEFLAVVKGQRMRCVFEGQVFVVEIVEGSQNCPEMKVYPQDSGLAWKVSLGGFKGAIIRTLYTQFRDQIMLSAHAPSTIKCHAPVPQLNQEKSIHYLTNFFSKRIFRLHEPSSAFKKELL